MKEDFGQGLAWIEPGAVRLVKGALPTPDGSSHAIIEVEMASVCGSDLKIIDKGNARVASGRIMGHEVFGRIVGGEELPAHLTVGDFVAVGADYSCGACKFCFNGMANNCAKNMALGHQIDGGFADYLFLPEEFLLRGPIVAMNNTPAEIGVLAEPLACVMNGMEVMGNPSPRFPDDIFVILGAGPIGILFARLAARLGFSRVMVSEPSAQRVLLAQQVLGSGTQVVEATESGALEELISEESGGLGAGVVVVASTSREAQSDALRLAGKRGRINFFGGIPGGNQISFDSNKLHYDEILLTGSHGSDPRHFEQAAEMLTLFPSVGEGIVSDSFPLTSAEEAFRLARSGNAIKVAFAREGG